MRHLPSPRSVPCSIWAPAAAHGARHRLRAAARARRRRRCVAGRAGCRPRQRACSGAAQRHLAAGVMVRRRARRVLRHGRRKSALRRGRRSRARGAERPSRRSRSVAGPDRDSRHLRRSSAGAPVHLTRGGWLLLEHGSTQAAGGGRLLARRGFADVDCHSDYSGLPRVTRGTHSIVTLRSAHDPLRDDTGQISRSSYYEKEAPVSASPIS